MLTSASGSQEEPFSVGDRVVLKERYAQCPPGTVCTVARVDYSVFGSRLLTVRTEATGEQFGAYAHRFVRYYAEEPTPAPSAAEDLKVGDFVVFTGTRPAPGFPEISSGRVGRIGFLYHTLARVDFGAGMARVAVRREHLRPLTVGETVTSSEAARIRGSIVRSLRDDVARKEQKIQALTAQVEALEKERADVARRTAIHARRTRRALDTLAAVTAPTAEDLPF